MAKTNLQVKAKNAMTNQSITTTLTYVNPEANSTTLKTFATKLNALTTNIYEEANRVQTINVDTEETPKKIPTITFAKTTYTLSQGHIYIPLTDIQTDSTGNIWGIATFNAGGTDQVREATIRDNNLYIQNVTYPTTITLKLAIETTEQYTAATTTATITAVS